MITLDFFKSCESQSSQFNINYAKSDYNWNLLKDTYYKNIQSKSKNPIPNIFHFIWLGGETPDMYLANIDDWKRKNPLFEFMIWDDATAENLMKKTPKYKEYKESDNFGNKSDMLRYAILYEYGGIYLDTDFLCVSSCFSNITKCCSFFSCLMFDQDPVMTNGAIGCSKNNKIVLNCLLGCSNTTYKEIPCRQTRTLFQTGPFLLSQCIFNKLRNEGNDDIIIFPTMCFFPFPAIHRNSATEKLIYSCLKPESVACHMWHCSWQPDSKFYLGGSSND